LKIEYTSVAKWELKPRNDRNTFHHLNRDIPVKNEDLEKRAEECVNALFEIESELFAYSSTDGKIIPKNVAYWPKADEDHLEVFLRSSH